MFTMSEDKRFAEAIVRIDAANGEDPRSELVDGQPQPRELLFSHRVLAWVRRLSDNPSEALLLAARAHTMRRWAIPRDRYAKTTKGYHEWRNELAMFHAEQAATILCECGYGEETVGAVTALITRRNWPADDEARVLEDADCLVFLETKLQNYTDEWDEAKALRVLRGTLKKMTPQARERASQLKLGPRERDLVDRAAS